jgi:hypothetical protein
VLEEGIQEPRRGSTRDQARAELTQHEKVAAGVGAFKPEGIFPVHTTADGLGRLAVGQVFGTLPDTHQGQSPRTGRWLPMRGEHVGAALVRIEGAEFVP